MSIWTHVNSSFRLDSLFGVTDKIIEEVFGVEVPYQELGTPLFGKKILPMGSEGSLHISKWKNPDGYCIASATINVFGDLRDFGNEEVPELKAWFEEVCDAFPIRQAIMQIEVEGGVNIILARNDTATREIDLGWGTDIIAISTPLQENVQIKAEVYTPGGEEQLSIYLSDNKGIIQDICMVKRSMDSDDKVECFVWDDENSEDYTNKHVIPIYKKE